MPRPERALAASAALAVMLAIAEGGAAAAPDSSSSGMTPLPCTGIPAQGSPTVNNGAGSTQCETTTPQPFSNADENNHGANTTSLTNPYIANGFGQVQGGHLAGTEGKADNKFPPGQAPNGTDSNRGYECDQNPGIGNGNPAHTTCKAQTVTTTPPTTTPTTTPSVTPTTTPSVTPTTTPSVTPTTTPSVTPTTTPSVVTPGAPSGGAVTVTPAPQVEAVTVTAPSAAVAVTAPTPAPAAVVAPTTPGRAGAVSVTAPSQQLARTGAATGILAAIGTAMVGLGLALLAMARRARLGVVPASVSSHRSEH